MGCAGVLLFVCLLLVWWGVACGFVLAGLSCVECAALVLVIVLLTPAWRLGFGWWVSCLFVCSDWFGLDVFLRFGVLFTVVLFFGL